ncbi:MAG: ribose 5-phosphate isomerase B [Planctomycetota bacterium]
MSKHVVIGADHRGIDAANTLAGALRDKGHTVDVFGPASAGESVDYPSQAWAVGTRVGKGEADFGVLVCGTAIGMSIAANKLPGVRAAIVHDELTAGLSRSHNDANVICLSGDLLGMRLIEKIMDVFLTTGFEGGRHARRVEQIERIERGQAPTD